MDERLIVFTRWIARSSCLLLLFFSFISASYADFNDGVRAYQAKNYRQAHDIWLPMAENGHVLAQTLLGSLYAYGEGVDRDDTKAAYWYELAANGGSSQAQYNLGILYENGWGVEKSTEKARIWFRKAADNGRKDAASRLALLADLAHEEPDKAPSSETTTISEPAGLPLLPYIDINANKNNTAADEHSAWLARQPAHFYTVQLVASSNRALLEANLHRLPLEQDYAVVESGQGNTPWFALIYGSYSNAGEARKARDNLPVSLSAWGPWIKPFGDIRSWRRLAGLESGNEAPAAGQ